MMVSQLMQRLEKLVMSTMVPIRVIAVFVLDLRALAVSMLLSEQAVRSLVRSLSIMNTWELKCQSAQVRERSDWRGRGLSRDKEFT